MNLILESKQKDYARLESSHIHYDVAKTLLKLRPILFIGAILGGFALGGAFTGGALLSGGVSALIGGLTASALAYSIISTRYISILKDAEKKVELLEIKLEEADKLEEKYKSELESAKEL